MGSTLESVMLQAETRSVPLTAVCEITHACNVDCEHCYLDLVPDSKINALSTEEWKRIFREIRVAGGLFLTLTGGEVLVRRDWFELATYAREVGFAVRIFSNGTLIDDKAADKIASLPPIAVEISLLGGIPATHDAIMRRRGAFDKTIAGAKRLTLRKVPVLLKCVLMKRNVGEIDMLRAIAAEIGSYIQFDIEVTPKNNGSHDPQGLAPGYEDLVAAQRKILEIETAHRTPMEPVDRTERLAQAPCAAGRRTVHIGPTGDLSPCTQWAGTPVGNIRHQSFAEVWGANDVLKKIRSTNGRDFEVCATCELYDVCGPCMAMSYLERGVVDGPSPTKCATAELRAKAQGIPGRSAWLLLQEAARASGVTRISSSPEPNRVRLPLVG
jgi:radical SAM protein with 4Fe4S-binding SPASM domain